MAITSNYPAIRPSLNLDFANTKALDPRITFSRASAATYYDGKTVAKAEENLLLHSQDFDNGLWAKGESTIAANTDTAPDGTVTADTLTAASTVFANGGRIIQDKSTLPAGTYTLSVWIKRKSGTGKVGISLFNTETAASATALAVTDSWQRFSITSVVSSSSTFFPRVILEVASDSIAIWGAQLEQRSQVTAYTPTTTQPVTNYIPVLQTAPAGVPRFDHNPVTGESLGLLVEEQRTNLLTYSEQLDNAAWPKANAIIIPNSVTSPVGTLDADIFASSATAGGYYYRSVALSTGSTYTYSCYFKQFGANTSHNFYFNDSAPGQAIVAILATNGVLSIATISSSGVFSSASASITFIGNGWYRVSLTATYAGGVVPGVALASNTGRDGYSGLCVWGLQVEAGSFPTSYIKTEASQATRAPDSAQMTGANFSFWYSKVEGTLLVEARNTIGATVFSTAVLTDDQAIQTNNRLAIFNRPNGVAAPAALISYGNAEQISNSFTFREVNKIAVAYKNNDVTAALNGATSAQDTAANIPAFTRLRIGQLSAGSDFFATQTIKRLVYYPKALPSSVQALTA